MKKEEYKNYLEDFMLMVSGFEKYYFRDPKSYVKKIKSSNPERVFIDFIEHTFVKYDCHFSFKSIWYEIGEKYFKNIYGFKSYSSTSLERVALNCGKSIQNPYFLELFFSQVSGGSVFKEYFKGVFTKKEAALIVKPKNKDFSVSENMVFAIAFQHSKDFSKSLRVSKSKLAVELRTTLNNFVLFKDKNRVGFFDNYGDKLSFIRNCIMFFTNVDPESVEEIDDITDYFLKEYNENNKFSPLGKKYTIETARKKTDDWHRALRRVAVIGNSAWDGHPIEDTKYEFGEEEKFREWKFVQIKKGKELAKEGNLMRHCVYSYKDGCIKGNISIWSLKVDNKRAVTIELGNDGKIRQARGKANRRLKKVEKEVINKWANDNFLDFSLRC